MNTVDKNIESFKENFKVGDLITHQGLIDANFSPSKIELIGIEKFAVIDSLGEIITYYINSHEWIKVVNREENPKGKTIQADSSLYCESVWEHFIIQDGDIIPQKILEVRANGDIFWKDRLISTDKELTHALMEVCEGTMKSKELVSELTQSNLRLMWEVDELREKLENIKSIINKN